MVNFDVRIINVEFGKKILLHTLVARKINYVIISAKTDQYPQVSG